VAVELCQAQNPLTSAVGPCLKDKDHESSVHEGWHAGGYRSQWREDPEYEFDKVIDKAVEVGYEVRSPGSPVFAKLVSADDEHVTFGLFVEQPREPTFQEVFRGIFDETFDLLVERQKKYGPDNIAQQGLFGVFGRISNDKIQRLKRSLNGVVYNGDIVLDAIEDFEDESFEDSLKDVANYALIMLALHRGVWGAPLE
jgi:hypothetical protein